MNTKIYIYIYWDTHVGGILKQETTVVLYCLHLIQALILDDFAVFLFCWRGMYQKRKVVEKGAGFCFLGTGCANKLMESLSGLEDDVMGG